MDRNEIIARLKSLPQEIEVAEIGIIKESNMLQTIKENLTAKQDELILSGVIDGKNEAQRTAQLRERTTPERVSVQQAENKMSGAKAALNRLLNIQANYRAIAGLLKAGE